MFYLHLSKPPSNNNHPYQFPPSSQSSSMSISTDITASTPAVTSIYPPQNLLPFLPHLSHQSNTAAYTNTAAEAVAVSKQKLTHISHTPPPLTTSFPSIPHLLLSSSILTCATLTGPSHGSLNSPSILLDPTTFIEISQRYSSLGFHSPNTYHKNPRTQNSPYQVCEPRPPKLKQPLLLPILFHQSLQPANTMSSCTALTFGTKTPYIPPKSVEGLRTQHPFPSDAVTRLIHVSLVARHGTRNPTRSCLDRMQRFKSWLRTALPIPSPYWLDRWDQELENYGQNPGHLTVEGEQELWHIARRFALNYASSLHSANSTVRIRSSYKERAVASARSFLEGYLQTCQEENLPLPVALHAPETECDSDSDPEVRAMSQDSSSESSSDDDPLVEVLQIGQDASLRFYDRHAEYALFTMNHKASVQRNFGRGSHRHLFIDLADRIGKSLGTTVPMDVGFVRVVMEACAFDYAHGRAATSPFCCLISKKDTTLFELVEKRHRPFFQAHERFRAVAAPLVADLAASLTACISDSPSTAAYAADLRFAHAETLVPLLLLLGIQSNGLSPEDPEYRTGLTGMSPFAANLAIELYESSDSSGISYFVRFRLHERYVEHIPALGEHGRTGAVRLEHLLAFFEEVLAEGMHDFEQ